MNQRFNLVQCNRRVMPGSDKAHFDVIDGQVSPEGYAVMPYTTLRDWLPLAQATAFMQRCNTSVNTPRRSEEELTKLIILGEVGDTDYTQEAWEALHVERLPYKKRLNYRDLQEAYPELGLEWESSFIRDEGDGQYAIHMSGYYTAAELRAQLEELERANSVWEPAPPVIKEPA